MNAEMPRSMPGRFSPLRDRNSPPARTRQWTSGPLDTLDFELDDAVVEEQLVARFDDLGQPGKSHRGPSGVANDVLRGQGEGAAGSDLDGFLGQVGRCASSGRAGRPSGRSRGRRPSRRHRSRSMRAACSSNVPCEKFRRATLIPARIICSSNCRRIAGRPDGSNDFRLVRSQ